MCLSVKVTTKSDHRPQEVVLDVSSLSRLLPVLLSYIYISVVYINLSQISVAFLFCFVTGHLHIAQTGLLGV